MYYQYYSIWIQLNIYFQRYREGGSLTPPPPPPSPLVFVKLQKAWPIHTGLMDITTTRTWIKCPSSQAYKPTSPQAHKPTSPQAHKPTSPQAHKPTSPQACKPASTQENAWNILHFVHSEITLEVNTGKSSLNILQSHRIIYNAFLQHHPLH